MRRSLTFKWSITLLLTSLTAVVLVGLFAYRTTVNEFDRLRVDQAQTTFLSELTTYYQDHGSWSGVEDWLRQNTSPPGSQTGIFWPQLFALADANGVIVLGNGLRNAEQGLTAVAGDLQFLRCLLNVLAGSGNIPCQIKEQADADHSDQRQSAD